MVRGPKVGGHVERRALPSKRHCGVRRGAEAVVVRRGVVRERRDPEQVRTLPSKVGRRVLPQNQIVAPMRVRRGPGGLGQDGVVVEHDAGGAEEAARASREVVGDVPNPVDGSAEHGLAAERVRRVVDEQVPEHAHVVQAPVRLDRVVVGVGDVVVVEVDRDGTPVPELARRILRTVGHPRSGRDASVGVPVGLHVDPVVEVGDVVVGHDVSGAVELHGHIGRHDGGMDLTVDAVEPPPERRVAPADQALRVIPAVEPVVGDVEVARTPSSS